MLLLQIVTFTGCGMEMGVYMDSQKFGSILFVEMMVQKQTTPHRTLLLFTGMGHKMMTQ